VRYVPFRRRTARDQQWKRGLQQSPAEDNHWNELAIGTAGPRGESAWLGMVFLPARALADQVRAIEQSGAVPLLSVPEYRPWHTT
jgi:hypothetical protein